MLCMLDTFQRGELLDVFIIGFSNRRLLLFDEKYVDVGRVPFRHNLDYLHVNECMSVIESGVNELHLDFRHTFIMFGVAKSYADGPYVVAE